MKCADPESPSSPANASSFSLIRASPDNIEVPIWKLREKQAKRGEKIMDAFTRMQAADGGDRRRGEHNIGWNTKTFARRTIGSIEDDRNLAGLESPAKKKIPFSLAHRDNDASGSHEDRMAIERVVNSRHERHAGQLRGKIAENRA